MDQPTIRPIRREELHPWFESMGLTFGFDPSQELTDDIGTWYNIDRARVAEADGRFVGTFSAFDLELTIPGARVPMSGVTQVTVAATHRRRGLLRSFMQDHFREVTDRGWPLAGLWASEATIYSRYGYGIAAWAENVTIERPDQAMLKDFEPDALVRFSSAAEAPLILPGLHDRVAGRRPGIYRRTEAWWKHRVLRDREIFREGYTAQRIVIAERAGEPVGYAIYRTKGDLGMELRVSELFGVDPGAERSLWHYLLGVDLITKLTAPRRPTDDPFQWWLADIRAAERTLTDTLWLRILDVTAALEARSYASNGRLVIEVEHDSVERYELEVTPEGASCIPTTAPADVRLPIDTLGSLYLGGMSALTLRAGGRLDGPDGAVQTLDHIMRWPIAPWSPEIF